MKYSIIGLIVNFAFLFGSTLQAANIAVSMNTDRTTYYADDTIDVRVEVNGSRNSTQPKLLNVKDFSVSSRGSSSQFQVINGRMNASIIHNFSLQPNKPGTYSIGPAVVTIDGDTYKSAPIKIKILKPTEKPKNEIYYYIEAGVDNTSPYVNEQIIYSFKFFNRAQIADVSLEWPKFEGFWKEDLGKQREYRTNIDGVNWNVTEIRVALFPTGVGVSKIEAAKLHLDVVVTDRKRRRRRSIFDDSFFGGFTKTKRVRVSSKPIQVITKPLPKDGKPKDFSNLIGQYVLESDLSKNQIEEGESTTLTIKLSGIGNIRDAKLPQLNWDNIKQYEDKPTVNIGIIKNKSGGNKEFKIALVPLKEGLLELSPIEINYFDPSDNQYKKLTSKPFKLNILKGSAQEDISHVKATSKTPSKKEVKVLGQDLMPYKGDVSSFTNYRISKLEKIAIATLIAILPFFYLLAFMLKRRRDSIKKDDGYFRRENALKNFNKSLKGFKNDDNFYPQGSSILRDYIGDKFNIDGKALTTIDTARRLQPFGLTESTIEEINQFLQTCDMGSYGGADKSTEMFQKLKSNLGNISKLIEKEAR